MEQIEWKRRFDPPPPGYKILVVRNLKEKMKQIEANPPPISGFKISRLQYLIHLILSHKQDKHSGSYSVLNMEYMNKVVPGASKYMEVLKDEGIIEWVNHSSGRNSRMYRLVNHEAKAEFRTMTDQQLIYRIRLNQETLKRRNSKKYPKLNETIRQVKIDYQGALRAIHNDFSLNHNEGRRTFLTAEVEKINNGEIFINVNTTNYRLDSNFTRLPSFLFPYLSVDNLPLLELDITNSQPFFAAALFNPTPEIWTVVERYLGDSLTIPIKTLQARQYQDLTLYTSLVTSGKFYEYMAERFRENNIPYKDRRDLKEQLFIVFFGKGISYKFSPAANLFRESFPTVHRLFYEIKEKHHNRLAILLQRVEAYVMLDRVVPEVHERFPNLKILTKHDSIQPFLQRIFVQEEAGVVFVVGKLICDTIEQVTGLRPSGKMKKHPKS